MGDKTYKNLFDDGYTTYHEDGTKSKTYNNFFDDGQTTYHEDGSKSKTYKNFLDDGYTTYHDDGSKSRTYKNFLDDGYTTYHDDGSKSRTYKNFLDNGYTTYHENGNTHPDSFNTDTSVGSVSSGLFRYSTTYVIHPNLDFSCIVVSIIGVILIPLLCWLYTSEQFVAPSLIFDGTFLICLLATRSKKAKPYIWSWLFYMSTMVMFMLMINNRNFISSSPISLLIYLAPLANAFIIGFIAALINYEEAFMLPVIPYIFMAIIWLCCVYKSKYPTIYNKCIKYEILAIIVIAVITLIYGFFEAKKQQRLL